MNILFIAICLPFATATLAVEYNEVDKNIVVGLDEVEKKYKPSWEDLDTRPLPQWYDQAKVGIFIHWGVFSVPSFGSEWFWSNWNGFNFKYINFMKENYPPGFSYQEFAPMFHAEFFEPDKWATLFAKSGAKYVVLTSKHHEGYTLFPSRKSFSWNAMEVGPKRDLVRDLAKAVRSQNLKFGVYHSLYEWFNPIYLEDKDNLFTTRVYPDTKLWPDIKQVVEDYEPSVLWSDGDWEANDTYWNSTSLLAWLYNESPVKNEIVVNDRWGIGVPCHHGDFYNCADRYNPGVLQNHKWENAFTLDSVSWGYRRNMELIDVYNIDFILKELASTVSCGGNVLINIGPTKEGTIAPIFQERLLELGQWLEVNGDAIYGTSPFSHQNDSVNSNVWYTCKKTKYDALYPTSPPQTPDEVTAVYAIVLKWPAHNMVTIKDIATYLHTGKYIVTLLGNEDIKIDWKIVSGVATITLPDKAIVTSQHAWSLKFTPK